MTSSSVRSSAHSGTQPEMMTDNAIMKALAVEKIDTDLYKSIELWHPAGSRGAYGGQMIAQALRAAWNTVPEDFHAHSQHNYFLIPGNSDIPVIYQVKRIRDGRSFKTRAVIATQNGKTIVLSTCSFTRADGSINLDHQAIFPSDLPQPEDLMDNSQRVRNLLDNPTIAAADKAVMKRFVDFTPIEYRDIHISKAEEYMNGSEEPLKREGQWFKAREFIPVSDPALHACVIAYASDSGILMSSVRANPMIGRRGIGMMASLDHSIWFHAPARADEWLYHDLNSPRSTDERGMGFGRIFNRQGVLVATTAQEGIVRLTRAEQEKRKANSSVIQARM